MRASHDAAGRPEAPLPSLGGRPPGRGPIHESLPVIGLIVDDEVSAITTFTRMLESFATEVLSAATAAKARELALTRQPHLVLLDVRLKSDHGLDWLADMRALGVLARVVVVSGFLDDEVIQRARSLGALGALGKPVRLDDLLATVEHALRARGPAGDAWATGFEGTPVERWVTIVLRTIENPNEPYALESLSREGAVSLSSLKRLGADVKISPHDMRDLVRMLWLLVWSRRLAAPIDVLSHTVPPALARLATRSGIGDRMETATVRELLDHQQFVPSGNIAFRLLRRALLAERLAAFIAPLLPVAMLVA